jgi:hypothetical protein
MPWAGTRQPTSELVENFKGVRSRWTDDSFEITDTVEQADEVAIFGNFKPDVSDAQPTGRLRLCRQRIT